MVERNWLPGSFIGESEISANINLFVPPQNATWNELPVWCMWRLKDCWAECPFETLINIYTIWVHTWATFCPGVVTIILDDALGGLKSKQFRPVCLCQRIRLVRKLTNIFRSLFNLFFCGVLAYDLLWALGGRQKKCSRVSLKCYARAYGLEWALCGCRREWAR